MAKIIDEVLRIICTKEPMPYERFDNAGYCVVCAAYHNANGEELEKHAEFIKSSREIILFLLARNLIRRIDINCSCGCDVGVFDMDLSDYMGYDISL